MLLWLHMKQWTEVHNTVYQPRVKMYNSGHRLASPQLNPYPLFLSETLREQMRTDFKMDGVASFLIGTSLPLAIRRRFEFPMIGRKPENQGGPRDCEN